MATFDGELGSVYLDGVLDGSAAVDHGIAHGGESLLIDAMSDRDYDFPGHIDEVALWDYPMSAAEVAALYDRFASE